MVDLYHCVYAPELTVQLPRPHKGMYLVLKIRKIEYDVKISIKPHP